MARTNPTAWIRVPNGGTPEQPSVYTAIREALQEGADAARDLQAQLDKLKGTGSGNGSALSPTTQYILSGGGVAPTAATVESVGLAAPTEFTVTNSPVTTTGTLTLAWANATQNYVFAAPSASTGTPSFRALVSGDLPTVPVSKGGTNLTSLGTANQVLGVNNGTTALEYKTVTAGSGISISHAAGSITITNTSPSSGGTVTSVTGTSPVSVATGTTTPVISLNAAYGDTLNPYGSKTANYVLAAPDGMAGVPSFRALVANDIPNISAAKITSGTLALARGGTGADLSATGGTGQYVKQATMGGAFSVGTIPASDIASGQALTASNDTNVTLTLGGTPSTALLKAASITAGWSGQLSVARGGTALSSLGTANQVLGVNNGVTALEYKTVTAGTGISISHAAGSITITNTSPSSGGTVTSVTASSPLASSGGTTPNISLTGTVAIANGGTGQTTATAAFDALSPLTTLGDIIYHNGTDNVRLAGNTTTTKQFLRQTGNGTISAAPAWDTVTKTDVGLGNVENTALTTWAGSTNLITLGTVTTGTWSATTIAVGKGGTGLTSTPTNGQLLIGNGTGYTLATLTAGSNITITNGMGSISIAAATGMSNPMTTLGDIIYGGASGTPTRLPGETTTTRKFLLSVGSAGAALAPAWATLTSADIPSLSATYLPLAGGTMSGDINLGNNELVNVNNITIGSATVDTTYAVDVNDTSASGIISRFKNANTGSQSYISVEGDTAVTRVWTSGSAVGGAAPFNSNNTSLIQGTGAGGLYLMANDAAGIISFITAGLTTANERMKIAANGNITMDTDTLFVDAVNNEVGVGTIAPSQKLDVAGTLIVTGNSDMPVSAGTNVRITGGYANPDVGRIFIGDGSGWKLHFSSRVASTNTDRVTIQDNGNFIVDTNTLYVDAVNNRVGIGTTPSFPFHFQVSSTETTSFAYKLRANWDLTPSGASAATQYMSYLTATTTGANFTGNLFGSYNNVAHNGASNVSTYGAVGGFVALQSTGNMGNAYAFYAGAPSRVSTGTITNAVGLYIVAQAVTGVTNPYGIYQAGTSDENVFAGKVSIGAATDPTNALDVTGVATVSGNFTVDTNTFHVDATNNRIGVGTTTPSVLAHFFQSTTGDAQVQLNNNNAGTAARMTYLLTNGTANAGLELTGASFTTYPSRLKLYNGAAGGVVMESDNAAGFFSVSTAATFPTGERMRIKGDVKALSGLTSVISLGLNAGSYAGATIIYTVEATDGTNHQCASGIVSVAIARNTAGTYATGQVSDTKTASSSTSAATLTVTWSAPTGANPSLVQVTATSTLVGATARIRYTVFRNGEGTLNIL